MSNLNSRITRLQRAVVAVGGGRCPECHDGEFFFIIRRTIRGPGREPIEEVEPGTVYDATGHCLTCGTASVNVVVLERLESIGDVGAGGIRGAKEQAA